LAFDLNEMFDEVVEPFVNVKRCLPFETLRDAVGTEHGNFGGNFGDALAVAEFLQGQIARKLQALSGTAPGNDRRAGFVEILLGALERSLVKIPLLVI